VTGWRSAALVAGLSLLAAGCGGSVPHPGAPSPAARPGTLSGPVDVLYAGSLVSVMERQLGPAYDRATGASFQGFAGGSTALANQVKGGVRVGDVFVSAAVDADTALSGAANGNWVSWYITFGHSPLVIGYSPHSRFAADFRRLPWYRVLTLPGIRVGRTDPATDPKGQLTIRALTDAQSLYRLRGLAARVEARSVVFPEETLVGRLQSGQLDAAFFYTLEAAPLHLPTVSLGLVKAGASYTVTILNRAPHVKAAEAFVAFLLSDAGRALLSRNGMVLSPPTLTGPLAAVPAALRAVASR
jgi:molybdate/tungstate transport system substrate-binding protein